MKKGRYHQRLIDLLREDERVLTATTLIDGQIEAERLIREEKRQLSDCRLIIRHFDNYTEERWETVQPEIRHLMAVIDSLGEGLEEAGNGSR